MNLGVVVLVLLAALCHATWNAFVKASDDRLADLAAINPVGAATGLLTIPGHRCPAAVLRETSVLFAALIGALFLRERLGASRIPAALTIALGVVLIAQAR